MIDLKVVSGLTLDIIFGACSSERTYFDTKPIRTVFATYKLLSSLKTKYMCKKFRQLKTSVLEKDELSNTVNHIFRKKFIKKENIHSCYTYYADVTEVHNVYKHDGFYINTYASVFDYVYVDQNNTVSQVNEKIKNFIYKNVGKNLVLSKPGNEKAIFVNDPTIENVFKGKQFYDILNYIKSFHKQDINRSILLYGKPGTGKSVYARELCNDLKFTSIRLDANSIQYGIINILADLSIDAIIIDEIDKLEKFPADFLDIIQLLKTKTKLIIFTANSKEYLDKYNYLIRPGRIDDLFEINSLEKPMIINIIGKNNEDIYEQIKHFPTAFVIECKNIIDVFGKQHFIDNFDKLNKRFELNNQ